jgi:hypothetical protein
MTFTSRIAMQNNNVTIRDQKHQRHISPRVSFRHNLLPLILLRLAESAAVNDHLQNVAIGTRAALQSLHQPRRKSRQAAK